MTRTVQDFDVPGTDESTVRAQIRDWLIRNKFRILDEQADGTVKTYDAPELFRNRGRVRVGHLRFAAPPGSIVGLNVAAAGGDTPVVFALACGVLPGAIRVHGEFFHPTMVEGIGGGSELKMINTIWAPAGIPRKKAYVLVTGFDAFIASLASPIRDPQ